MTTEQIERSASAEQADSPPVVSKPRPREIASGTPLLHETLLAVVLRVGLGLVSLVLASGIVGLLVFTKPSPEKVATPQAAMVVRGMPVVEAELPLIWNGYGTARAVRASDVAAQVSGRVIERPLALESGVPVAKDQILAELDKTDFEQRLASANQTLAARQADLSSLEIEESRLGDQIAAAQDEVEVAEAQLGRTQTAYDRGAANQGELDSARRAYQQATRTLSTLEQQSQVIPSREAALEAQVAGARADVRLAEENLKRATIRAPFAGVLQSIDVEVGEFAQAGLVVARVVDLSRVEVGLRVPVSAQGTLAIGDRAVLKPDGPGLGAWQAEVVRVAPEADQLTRTLSVFVEVTQDPLDRDRLLRPGRFVSGELSASGSRVRLVTPRRAVVDDVVLVAEEVMDDDPARARVDGAAAKRLRRLREADVSVIRFADAQVPQFDATETQWAVLDPVGVLEERRLAEGELVIVSNLDQLRAGSIVDVRLPDESIEAPAASDEPGTEGAP